MVADEVERRALVVEDDEDIRSLIEFTLSTQGFKVHAVDSGLAAVEEIRTFDPDLVTLDLGLPGIDGIETCRRIRELSDVYVIMITARDDEIDRLLGLETGADDFLSKPFSVRELKARVNALFRRPRRGAGSGPTEPAATEEQPPIVAAVPDHEMLEHGPLRVDVDGRRAFNGSVELTLTRTEFDLLTELDAHSRPRLDPRGPAALGVGNRLGERHPPRRGAHRQPPPQGRLRRGAGLHQDRARRRLPHGVDRRLRPCSVRAGRAVRRRPAGSR